MNSQISFCNDSKKDNLSTPKFPINKSIISSEKEEKLFDTLKKNIQDALNNEKIGNNNNEINNNESNDNKKISSILCNINNINDLNNYINQISFDETSQNFFFSKKENESENNIDKSISTNNNIEENNEVKFINNIENYLSNSNKKNEDNNFNYNLPLESDKSSENFNIMLFQQFPENIEDDDQLKKNNTNIVQIKTRMQKLKQNSEIENKKEKKIFLPKQRQILCNKTIKEDLELTPRKKNINNKNEIYKSANISFNQKLKALNSSKCSSLKKRKDNLKVPVLTDEYQYNKCFTEPNNLLTQSKIFTNSKKNTFFTSNDNKKEFSSKKDNKLKIIIKPFLIEKINNNNYINTESDINNYLIKEKIFKNITISCSQKVNKIDKTNINKRNNKFIDINENKFIYEKNLIGKKNGSFSIHQKDNKRSINSRNNSKKIMIKIKNASFNKKIKNNNSLNHKNNENSLIKERIKWNRNYSISALDNLSHKNIKKIKVAKTGKNSPFCKSKITNKKYLAKKFIFTQSSSVENKKSKIKDEKYKNEQIFISSNEHKNISKFTIFCNYDSKMEKNCLEETAKSKVNKIKVNIANNNCNNNKKFYLSNMTSKNTKSIFQNEKTKGNYTERNRDFCFGEIYSKKLIQTNRVNHDGNKYSSINTEKINNSRKIKKIDKTNNNNYNNKSSIINKNKLMIDNNNNNDNNSISIKGKNKYNDYFNEIISKIDLNKNIHNKKNENLNSKKNSKTRNLINTTNSEIYFNTKKNILLSSKINCFQPRYIYNNKTTKNSEKIKRQYNTINNSSNLEYNNKFRTNPKINKRKAKISFSRENSLDISNFKKDIVKYSILRNNKNNQVSSEVSLFIGKNNNINGNSIESNLDLYTDEYIQKKIGKYSLNNKLKAINVNRRTIINVNQFYPSYFINNNENLIKNKNNITSYI